MTETTTIRVEDAHPRPNARPLDDELVGRIAESIRLIGFSTADPVVVRREGDIFWVVDGGHRCAAAKLAGLEEVPAVVEDLDDAGVLTYEGSLNLQRPDTEEERWARAQQFFALGEAATPKQIEVATGVDLEAQNKARRVLKKLNDPVAQEDLTLEQAMAAHEFLENDKAFKKIMNAGANWKSTYDGLSRERVLKEQKAKALEIITAAGCEVIKSSKMDEHRYLSQQRWDASAPKSAKYAKFDAYGTTLYITWYGIPGKQKADPEAEKRRKQEEKRKAELDTAKAKRLEYVREHLSLLSGDVTSDLVEFTEKAWEDGRAADAHKLEETPLAEVAGFRQRVAASIVLVAESELAWIGDRPTHVNSYPRDARLAVDYIDALQSTGYEPCKAEKAVVDALTKALAAVDKKKSKADGGDAA